MEQLLHAALVRRGLIPFVPDTPRLRFQAVHSYDIGEAYRLAVTGDARGPYNVAAEPVVDPIALGRLLHARKVPVPEVVLRGAAALTWKLRLQPSPPGWIDLALQTPLLDASRAAGVSATVAPVWTLASRAMTGMFDVLATSTLRSRSGRPVRGSSSSPSSRSTSAISLPRSPQPT